MHNNGKQVILMTRIQAFLIAGPIFIPVIYADISVAPVFIFSIQLENWELPSLVWRSLPMVTCGHKLKKKTLRNKHPFREKLKAPDLNQL